MDLKSKAVNGAIWVTVEKFVGQFVSFIFGLILARILSPSDYGIVGMLAIFLGVASTFTDSGMGSALIQKQNRNCCQCQTHGKSQRHRYRHGSLEPLFITGTEKSRNIRIKAIADSIAVTVIYRTVIRDFFAVLMLFTVLI